MGKMISLKLKLELLYLALRSGRFFSIKNYRTKSGKFTDFNCRGGVKRYLKGGKNGVEGNPHYITIYDVHRHGYRTLRIEDIHEIHFNNAVYEI